MSTLSSTDFILELQDVSVGRRSSPDTLISGLSASVTPGELIAVVGGNGAGKSTLLRAIFGLEQFGGHIAIGGRPVHQASRAELASACGYMPQAFTPAFHFSVREYLDLAAGRRAGRGDAQGAALDGAALVATILQASETSSLSERRLTELSAGERQRVQFVGTLSAPSRLFLLDEPTSAQDFSGTAAMLRSVKNVVETGDCSALVVIHDLSTALNFLPRMWVLHEGSLIYDGPSNSAACRASLERCFGSSLSLTQDSLGNWAARVR